MGFTARAPALGHRVQVPARGEDDASARHHRAGGAHRRAHAGGGAGARGGGRLHGGPGDAAQPGRGAPQGRARGRHGHRAEGGRRHPRGAGAGALAAQPRGAHLGDAERVPELRQPRGARSGRGGVPLHLHRLPGPGAGAAAALGEPRGARHRRHGGGDRLAARGERARGRRGRLLLAFRRGAGELGHGPRDRPTGSRCASGTRWRRSSWRPSRRRRAARSRACCSGWASGTWARPRPRPLRRPTPPWTRLRRPARTSWRASTAWGRRWPTGCGCSSARRTTPRSSSGCARPA